MNITPKHNSKYFIIFLLLFGITIGRASANIELPELGDPTATILSAEEDRLLGQAFMRRLRSQVTIIEDPAITSYINALGYRLLASANTDLPYNFFVVDSPDINAFAGPGGHIGLNTGLIIAAESEAELAAVLAHEIAHVSQRHLARAFKKASNANLQMAAAIIAAILLGNNSGQLTEAAIMTSTAGNIQQQLNFTRQHEKEADRIGINTLADSGYDPHKMAAFFYRLQQAYRYAENGLPELLRTHPVTQSRIADATNRAAQMPSPQPTADTLDFGLLKAKLNSLTSTNDSLHLQALKSLIQKSEGNTQIIAGYEYTLINFSQGQYKTAAKAIQPLLAAHPEQPWITALAAKIEIAENKPDLAEKRLIRALKIYPYQPLLTSTYAETLLQNKKPEQAAIQMRGLIQQQKDFALPVYYQTLAKAETAANNKVDAYQALAEYYYLIGQTRAAISHLETAITQSNESDPFKHEQIKARLREIQSELLKEEEFEKQ